MAPFANNHTPDPRPTGDLEHLFRQKLGEAEVPPRQHVWEQLDHELLVRQNEAYRRRLLLHRWVAAACALLVLSCGSWLLLHNAGHLPPGTEMATTAARAGAPFSEEASANTEAVNDPRRAGTVNEARTSVSASTAVGAATAANQGAANNGATSESVVASVAGSLVRAAKSAVGIRSTEDGLSAGTVAVSSQAGSGGSSANRSAAAGLASASAENASAGPWLTTRPVRMTIERSALPTAFRRPEFLQQAALPATTTMLAQAPKNAPQAAAAMDDLPEEPRTRGKWRLSGAFAASSYNPNIDFNSGGARGTLNFGASPANGVPFDNSARAAYQYGASEYRENLQAGPAQRVAVAAAYSLNKHWTLLTGVEAAQQRAASKTSLSVNDTRSAFTGRPAADSIMAQFYNGQRTTDFSYRTVGVPVAVRYGSAKTGWSLYAKVGAAVNVLLKSRTEVDGNSAAARDYTLASSDSPYRKVLTSVRGGGGVRYQPTDATWSLALGPVAEAGLNTLNQNPGGSFFKRSRPYSVGLEASVEFGGQKAAAVH